MKKATQCLQVSLWTIHAGPGLGRHLRQNPLTVIGVLFALILLPVIGTITWKTSLSGSTSLYDEEMLYEEEDEDDWEEEDEDEGWE